MLIVLLGPDRYSVGLALKNYLAKYAPDSEVLGDLNLTHSMGRVLRQMNWRAPCSR